MSKTLLRPVAVHIDDGQYPIKEMFRQPSWLEELPSRNIGHLTL